ncbi:restriction endonuclease subunit S [Pseudoalteromonas arctica]|uniref:restriction endonuclease subunit S n=1 Tax=Pseudoalteromonas arctica TaxID=394751 RepID=UPI001C9C9218|nr:restriction endonuclease subunit S [Pseudoalteromonas arctica]MBZ2191420.1 restriction endonuclease subunit S [Pseudoalteromonas arctica]
MVPNGWNISSIDSISDSVKVGFVGSCQKDYRDSGIPLIRTTNLKNGKLDLKNIIYVTNEFHIKNKKSQLKEYDLLIARHGNHGSACMVPKGFQDANCLNIVIVRPDLTKVAPEFMLDLFNYSLSKKLSSKAAGSTQTVVNTKEIASQVATVPPLSEQRKIAKILSTWDKAISTTERLIDNSKQQKKALMQQLLTGKKRLLDDSGKPFEGEWVEITLEKLAKYRRGSFPQPYGNPEWVDEVNGYPFIQVYDIDKNMKLKPDTKIKISDAAIGKSVFIPKETVIVSLQGSIGRVAITQYDAYVDRTVLLFQEFIVPMDKVFFAFIIQELFEIEKTKAPGGTIKTITKEVLSNFKVHIPSITEQQKIASVLINADQEIELLEQQLADLKQEKKALMQQLLTGKRRVKVDDKEVA